ncbi:MULTISPECIES: hypothetical protein [unclassified Acinetobacter]|uniref:hypothetical protein n=1 Tax=unclassified Acinetobacter TaxID=196816 RepID=UPI0035B7F377
MMAMTIKPQTSHETVKNSDNVANKFQQLFQQYPLSQLFANMQAKAEYLHIAQQNISCTVIDDVTANCFTASPYAMMIDYGKDELDKLPTLQQYSAKILIAFCSHLLKLGKIDRVVSINNYCLSTNTLDQYFLQLDMIHLTEQATQQWTTHALMIRSINDNHYPNLRQRLKQAGWCFVVSRQVYLINNWQYAMQKINSKRDQKLLQDGKYYFQQLHADSPNEDFVQARHWYNLLYLQKYSTQNVQFSQLFLQQAVQAQLLDLYLLRDSSTHNSVAVVGIVIDGDLATVPIIGYDQTLPKSAGLYRRCMIHAMSICQQQKVRLNFSSGASDFKKVRGANAEIEYIAVYVNHLPWYRQVLWRVLSMLSIKYYAKLLQKYQL